MGELLAGPETLVQIVTNIATAAGTTRIHIAEIPQT
jgi:hypothetical protein